MGKAWVKARRHDRFYRAAKKQAYRSRAAIKLSQIDRRYGLFHEGAVVVDLGAAPGGWSQVARERVGPKGRVLAVDVAAFVPLDGVEFLRGDFRDPKVQALLFERLRDPAAFPGPPDQHTTRLDQPLSRTVGTIAWPSVARPVFPQIRPGPGTSIVGSSATSAPRRMS